MDLVPSGAHPAVPLGSGFPNGRRQLPGMRRGPTARSPLTSHYYSSGDPAARELRPPQPARHSLEDDRGPQINAPGARRRLLFKGKLPLFLHFTKVRSENNFSLINILLALKQPNQLPNPIPLSQVSSPLPFGGDSCLLSGGPAAGWRGCSGPQTTAPKGSAGHRGVPYPLPPLSGAGVFSGSEEAPADQRVLCPGPASDSI